MQSILFNELALYMRSYTIHQIIVCHLQGTLEDWSCRFPLCTTSRVSRGWWE